MPSRLVELDGLARRYRVLPSEFAKLPPDEIQFNILVASEALAAEKKAAEKASAEQSRGQTAHGKKR